jgi:hypothetical protein
VVVDQFAAAVGIVGSGGESCEAVPGSRIQRQPRPGPALLIGSPGLPTGRRRLPALFVAGECVVVWHADAGGFGGQVVIHQSGGPDGAIPDPFGRVDHVSRRRLVGLGDAAQQPGAALRPQVGVRGDPGRGAAAESVPRRVGITGRVRLLVSVWSPAVLAACGVFVAQLVDQGLDLVVVETGIDVRQAHRDAHPGGGSADQDGVLSLDSVGQNRRYEGPQTEPETLGKPLTATLTRGFRRKTGKSVRIRKFPQVADLPVPFRAPVRHR